ncbi:hypothetical protein [Azospirillum brasilense]|uniref:Uncharacterized protein n=1 Tax=Azospirillum brasilense TaxID=192 RepID=A0A235HC63_AZOBR|nr:hypothetical protein [Azospirillum brasilense]OYD83391.1 hypothetical protein CHT98_15845 [Azospirillum brasilense]
MQLMSARAMETVQFEADTAVVICADHGVFELLAGLLLSLRPLDRRRYRVCLVDVGLTAAQRDYVTPLCDFIAPVRDDLVVWPHPQLVAQLDRQIPFWKAMLCRPFLRDYFPGFQCYLHLDADVWVQNSAVLDAAAEGVRNGRAVIVPEADAAYPFLTSHTANAHSVRERAKLITRFFGEEVATLAGALPYYNLGFYGLRHDAPHWDLFRDSLRDATRTTFHFLCEQIVLNIVMFQMQNTLLLPATANWMCSMAVPMRGADGLWRSPIYPHTPIDLLHLTGTDKLERYRPLGLLYDGGRYLEGIAHLAAPHAQVG